MYDSGISAEIFIDQLKNDIDIAVPFPTSVYVDYLNAVEQLLYSEIIKEQAQAVVLAEDMLNSTVILSDISVPENQDPIQFDDIHCVYALHDENQVQLIRTNLTSGFIFPNCYAKDKDNLFLHTTEPPESVRIMYFVRPVLRTTDGDTVTGGNIHVPISFIDVVRSKVRGELYMLSGEYSHAANWLGVYNAQLENFKAYISTRTAGFGL